MDKYTQTDENWYTPAAQRYERERAETVLRCMKELEEECKKNRTVAVEKTLCGVRYRYLKKGEKR